MPYVTSKKGDIGLGINYINNPDILLSHNFAYIGLSKPYAFINALGF